MAFARESVDYEMVKEHVVTESGAHQYAIGDAVLVDVRGAQIPGVISDREGDQYVVTLAEPWADETGNRSDSVSVPAQQLSPSLESGTGTTQELPG